MHTNGTYSTKVSFVAHVGRKEAIQKTIAAMTLGKDVSALFPDVLKNIATHDLGQKKLVYLYLMYPLALKIGLMSGITRKLILNYVSWRLILSFKYAFPLYSLIPGF
jgi:Adaptin N terminal region